MPADCGRVCVFLLQGKESKFLARVSRDEALELLKVEPNSLMMQGRGPSLHITDPDSLTLLGRRFSLQDFIAKGFVFRERLDGDDWKDIHGNHFHVDAGYKVFAHRKAALRLGRPIMTDVVKAAA